MFAFGRVCLKQVEIGIVLNDLLIAEVCVMITRHLNLYLQNYLTWVVPFLSYLSCFLFSYQSILLPLCRSPSYTLDQEFPNFSGQNPQNHQTNNSGHTTVKCNIHNNYNNFRCKTLKIWLINVYLLFVLFFGIKKQNNNNKKIYIYTDPQGSRPPLWELLH